jgi:speckle-type POZ protein
MERLKPICKDRLCDYINTGTAVTTLVLMEQHGLQRAQRSLLQVSQVSGHPEGDHG